MTRKITSRAAGVWTGLAAACGLALATAAPAQAGEFSHGFENELGRIAAHAAVGAGLHLLHYAAPPPHYVEHRVVEVHRPHYRPHPRPYGHYRGHGHRKHYYKHHYKHRHHEHRYGPCDRVTIQRSEHYTRTHY